jgi:hypothetical protein
MQHILDGVEWQACLIYLDDVIAMGRDFENALNNLDKIITKLEDAGVKLKPKKCNLLQKEVDFLGHLVTEDGIGTTPDNLTYVKSFLGLATYYKAFIPSFGDVAKPLYCLSNAEREFVWDEECEQSFNKLKELLISAPILGYPNRHGKFILDTDASGYALGAVLNQMQEGQERVIAYASKTMSKTERNYCVTRRELFAVVTFVRKYRHRKKFTVRTDHSCLQWLMNVK